MPVPASRRARVLSFTFLAMLIAGTATLYGASYLPLSDAELAHKSPVIVRAEVLSARVAHAPIGGADGLFTVTSLRVLESLKGSDLSAGDVFQVTLPGGVDAGTALWIPGTPELSPGGEAVLFLSRRVAAGSHYALTEFGLSKFDLVRDRAGRAFAVRPVFSDDEDDRASRRRIVLPASAESSPARSLRDGGSFLAMVRSVAAGAAAPAVLYSSPDGELRGSGSSPSGVSKTLLWVNIGGVEGGGSLFRWYWDTGLSPQAIVSANGVQTGLSDGSNGASAVQNGATQWSAVPGSTVRYSFTSGSAPVVVNLDVTSQSGAWSDPLSCGSGGIIGYGGPGTARSAPAYRGESGYFAASSGNVWMRKVTGGCYSAATFKSAVLHELGHTLGLGHSDDGPSQHSTTSLADRNAAVMHSVIPSAHPSSPQADDVQAIQYYYGSGGGAPGPSAPSASFSFSPAAPGAGQAVVFADATTGSPTAWSWSFGDGSTAAAQNPSHIFAAGTFIVTLTASNAGGASVASRAVTVAPAAPSPQPLRAEFAFAPASPAAGAPVQFTEASSGAPTSWEWSFGDPASGNANFAVTRNPAHTFATAGTYTVGLTVRDAAGSNTATAAVVVTACGGGGALCLNGGRFRVQASWRVPSQGTSGAGTPVSLTGDTGYFWFFTSNNVELIVKVVDGGAVNGKFWVFSGALSDVEYTVQVTDTRTGAVRTYTNPQGTLASSADTSAFAPAAADAGPAISGDPAAWLPSADRLLDAAGRSAPGADAPCVATAAVLCLNGGRFRVDVAWQVPSQGSSGAGSAVPLTADTGYFWFFSANNVELVVKVVDGRAFNGRFWVFSGALSDVAYTVTVTDTQTGASRVYSNPFGRLASTSDLSAF
ncbi:MAG: PKD domain-containing protein [Acidobacteria bacterium]|nr:PKD domain-containing protein [Acidobacteriota bacterium]